MFKLSKQKIISTDAQLRQAAKEAMEAVETLRRHFFEPTQSGPLRCAAFALDGQPGIDDRALRERQIVEQLVTIGRALAGEG